jgi:hypothetical protein
VDDAWIEAGSVAFIGVLLLIALWPTEKTSAKVLRKWHVPDPTPAQVAESKLYLKRRRLLYPWLFVGISYGGYRVLPGSDFVVAEILLTVLAGMLLAELIASLRPTRGPRREAVLAPRRVLDLVPAWGLVVFGVCVVLVLVLLVRTVSVAGFVALGSCVAAVFGAVLLAVQRPTSGDESVDVAFRVRSARVALGLGVALTGVLAGSMIGGFASFAVVVAIGLGWSLVGPPPAAEMPARG